MGKWWFQSLSITCMTSQPDEIREIHTGHHRPLESWGRQLQHVYILINISQGCISWNALCKNSCLQKKGKKNNNFQKMKYKQNSWRKNETDANIPPLCFAAHDSWIGRQYAHGSDKCSQCCEACASLPAFFCSSRNWKALWLSRDSLESQGLQTTSKT